MASYQRKYGGRTATIYPRALSTDNIMGNEEWVVDWDNPVVRPYAGWWLRSSRAEVPGQLTIDIRRIVVDFLETDDFNVWGAVELSDEPGDIWDITAPPQIHWGVRGVRHLTFDLRRRPDDG